MTRFIFFPLLLLTSLLLEGQVCTVSGAVLRTQAEVNAFGNRPACGSIIVEGDLIIASSTDITSLAALEKVVEVRGGLSIRDIPNLNTLLGLHNLSAIKGNGNLNVFNCGGLTSLAGLTKLDQNGEAPYLSLDVSACPNLQSLEGLGMMTRIANIQIVNCLSFNSFSGFESLEHVERSITVRDVSPGTDYTGLENLHTVGRELRLGDGMSSFQGLNSIDSVGSLILFNNTAIESLQGLESLSKAGNLTIAGCHQLDSITGIDDLEGAGVVSIQVNNELTKIVLPNELMFGRLVIFGNPMLVDIIGEGVYTTSRARNGGSATSVLIADNDELKTLDRLGGELLVENLSIDRNDQLSSCEAEMICRALPEVIQLTVTNNAPGCNSPAEVEASCTVILPVSWQSFTATALNKGVQLNWSTALEENNAGYTVEHSLDGFAFNDLSEHLRPRPQNAGGGYAYAYFHETRLGGVHYYRIRQEDLEGTISYSGLRQVVLVGANAVRVYPTVVRSELTVESDLPQTTVRVLNLNGQEMEKYELTRGAHQFNTSHWSPGIYFLLTGDGQVRRVVK